jgi:cobalt-zinc-cadmium efflux system membrane fusion protein
MFMNAEIDMQSVVVNSLPEDAVVKWNNETYVFYEIAANQYKMLQVTTGNASDGYIEIKTTLPDAKVVIKNSYTLLTKMMNSNEE